MFSSCTRPNIWPRCRTKTLHITKPSLYTSEYMASLPHQGPAYHQVHRIHVRIYGHAAASCCCPPYPRGSVISSIGVPIKKLVTACRPLFHRHIKPLRLVLFTFSVSPTPHKKHPFGLGVHFAFIPIKASFLGFVSSCFHLYSTKKHLPLQGRCSVLKYAWRAGLLYGNQGFGFAVYGTEGVGVPIKKLVAACRPLFHWHIKPLWLIPLAFSVHRRPIKNTLSGLVSTSPLFP